jgi:hypothetical protein
MMLFAEIKKFLLKIRSWSASCVSSAGCHIRLPQTKYRVLIWRLFTIAETCFVSVFAV